MKHILFMLAMASMFITTTASAATGMDHMCGAAKCPPGVQVITYATKGYPFFACPSPKLSDYIGFVIGSLAIQTSLGLAPNLSPQTGEPEWSGDTERIVSALRQKAGVRTFDQAVAMCKKGSGGVRATVLNDGGDAVLSMWVSVNGKRFSFWAPKSAFNLVAPR